MVSIGFLCMVSCVASGTNKRGRPSGRTLNFPNNTSLGVLVDMDQPANSEPSHWWWGGIAGKWVQVGEAKGDVAVPLNMRLGFAVEPEGWIDLSTLANLAPDAIEALEFHGSPKDEYIDDIGTLTELKTLVLGSGAATHKGLASLKKLESLERLHIDPIDEDGMAIVGELTSLKGLRLSSESVITCKGFSHLARLSALEELMIGWKGYEGNGLVHLSQLPSLEYLYLSGFETGSEGLVYLGNIPSLQRLEFSDIRGEAIAALPDMPSLKTLAIKSKNPEFIPTSQLVNFTGLESLSLSGCFTDDGLAPLKELPALQDISLLHKLFSGRNVITDEGLAHLGKIQSLESVRIYTGHFTDKGLEHLSGLKKLKKLQMPNARHVTDSGMQSVASIGHLETLYLNGSLLTHEGMRQLAKLTNLKSLRFLSPSQLTNQALAELAPLQKLEQLELGYAPNVTVSGLNGLNRLAHLRALTVRGISNNDAVLDLSGLPRLEQLELPGIGDDDLACLAQLKHLKKLTIRSGNTITDAGLAHLEGISSLRELEIRLRKDEESRISQEAITRLKKNLPNLVYYSR
ncbi:Internalin-A [Pontiella desulfatans]|uniref:Internalin-A n=1 Tax=Pontiella desulfatans TaxID=2750659 RepID=A0A6C2TXM1_PONDE|nr:Internalin-A [Pontiella desulfatans]